MNGGYQVSISHCVADSIKTNAPPDFIWDMMRAWVRGNQLGWSKDVVSTSGLMLSALSYGSKAKLHPIHESRMKEPRVAALLSKETT